MILCSIRVLFIMRIVNFDVWSQKKLNCTIPKNGVKLLYIYCPWVAYTNNCSLLGRKPYSLSDCLQQSRAYLKSQCK